jgi:hypothetical protein
VRDPILKAANKIIRVYLGVYKRPISRVYLFFCFSFFFYYFFFFFTRTRTFYFFHNDYYFSEAQTHKRLTLSFVARPDAFVSCFRFLFHLFFSSLIFSLLPGARSSSTFGLCSVTDDQKTLTHLPPLTYKERKKEEEKRTSGRSSAFTPNSAALA